jgi:hypothetical protein
MTSPKKKLNPNEVIHKSVKDLANLLKSALSKLNIVIANKQIVREYPLTYNYIMNIQSQNPFEQVMNLLRILCLK